MDEHKGSVPFVRPFEVQDEVTVRVEVRVRVRVRAIGKG